MTIPSGARLGPYEVIGPLGAGGMGEVYRARDARLGRAVALKVLSAEYFEDADRRARFEREARVLASLNHPGIAVLYSFEAVPVSHGLSTRDVLVMELIEGETLAERIGRGALPLRQVLGLGEQIATALAAAHRKGIAHRDLKPGNIMVTASGAKLLDFGLAKTLRPGDAAETLTSGPKAEPDITREGAILGTIPYMAPEQLEGKDADARSDIFSLGSVLYEMATGRRAFSGASQASLMSAILSAEPPPVSAIQPMAPPALDHLVRTCLAKEPDERWQNAGDVARQLRWIAEASGAGTATGAAEAGRPRRRERLAWGVAAMAGLLAVAGLLRQRPEEKPAGLTRFKILAPSGQSFLAFAVLSPDARRLLLLLRDDGGKNSLAVRSLDDLGLRLLPGTDDVRGAFWSPDSREVAFFADGKLRRMSADGGPSLVVCESGAAVWGAWGRAGTILFSKGFGGLLFSVPAAGGTPRPVTAIDVAGGDVHQSHPCFLPDGRHFVFLASDAGFTHKRILLGSLDSKEARPLFESDSSAVYAEPGYLLYARDNAVLARRFDPRSLQLDGEPVPAFENVHWMSADDFLSLSAADGRVAYVSWSLQRRLVWVDRKGRELGSLGEVGGYTDVRISPDGRRVAVALRDPAHGRNGDIWVLDAARGTGVRITAEPSDDFNPAWFPNGDRIAYVSDRFGFYDVFSRPAGGGPEEVLARTEWDKLLPEVLADGRHVLVSARTGERYSPHVLSLDEPGNPRPLGAESRFSEEHPAISADGRWIAFDSIESAQREVYLQGVPDGPTRQVSVGGGQMPVWSRNGRELFYAARDGMLMSVALHAEGNRLEPGEPQPLFPLQFDVSGELPWHLLPFDVAPDGQRFLVIRRAPGVEPDGVVVVTDWTRALAKVR